MQSQTVKPTSFSRGEYSGTTPFSGSSQGIPSGPSRDGFNYPSQPSGSGGDKQTYYQTPSAPGAQISQDLGFQGKSPDFSGSQGSSDDGSYDAGDYSAIPGQPGVDYPIYSEIPQTSFRCDQQQYQGYYADVETQCQTFHVCANNKTYDFLCPNGTIFHQEYLVCVWWNQFDCNTAPSLYRINENIYDYSKFGRQDGQFAYPQGAQGPQQLPSGSSYPGQNLQGSQGPQQLPSSGSYPSQNAQSSQAQQLPSGVGYPAQNVQGSQQLPSGSGYSGRNLQESQRPQQLPSGGGYSSQQLPTGSGYPSQQVPSASGYPGQGPQQLPSGAGYPAQNIQGPQQIPSGSGYPTQNIQSSQGPQQLPSGAGYPAQNVQGPQQLPSGSGYPRQNVQGSQAPQQTQTSGGYSSQNVQEGGYPTQQRPTGPADRNYKSGGYSGPVSTPNPTQFPSTQPAIFPPTSPQGYPSGPAFPQTQPSFTNQQSPGSSFGRSETSAFPDVNASLSSTTSRGFFSSSTPKPPTREYLPPVNG